MSIDWHADDHLLGLYVQGQAGALRGASVEQHLIHCPECRTRVAAHVAPATLELVWDRILEQAQAPRRTVVERVLVRLGVSEHEALLIGAAPTLRASWLLGMAFTLGFVAVAAGYGGTRGLVVFLLVAPLIPVAGVALAYGPDIDPAYEASVVAPFPGGRLLLLRTAAVLGACLPLLGLAGLLIPGRGWASVAWLLPALAFTALVLAASTWIRPLVAATGVAVAWVCVVGAGALAGDPATVLAPTLLLAYTVLGVVAVMVLSRRLHPAPMRSS